VQRFRYVDDLNPQFTNKNDNGKAHLIWGSLRVIDDKYEGSYFCIHRSSSSLPLHEYDCKNKFKVITDNPLMEMGVDMNYDNSLLELDGGVVPDYSIALGKNNKVWDPGEDL
jgi:hypothetical protein